MANGSGMISCIMATRGGLDPARQAIANFRRQTFAARELVVVCADVNAAVRGLVENMGDAAIRFIPAPDASTVGGLRNAAIDAACGEHICVWDDDDISHPRRLEWQAHALRRNAADICFLSRVVLWWPARRRLAVSARRSWENTMMARRAILPPYPAQRIGSDAALVAALRGRCVPVHVENPLAYVYVAHGSNLRSAAHFEMLFVGAREASSAQYGAALARLSPDFAIGGYPGA